MKKTRGRESASVLKAARTRRNHLMRRTPKPGPGGASLDLYLDAFLLIGLGFGQGQAEHPVL